MIESGSAVDFVEKFMKERKLVTVEVPQQVATRVADYAFNAVYLSRQDESEQREALKKFLSAQRYPNGDSAPTQLLVMSRLQLEAIEDVLVKGITRDPRRFNREGSADSSRAIDWVNSRMAEITTLGQAFRAAEYAG